MRGRIGSWTDGLRTPALLPSFHPSLSGRSPFLHTLSSTTYDPLQPFLTTFLCSSCWLCFLLGILLLFECFLFRFSSFPSFFLRLPLRCFLRLFQLPSFLLFRFSGPPGFFLSLLSCTLLSFLRLFQLPSFL